MKRLLLICVTGLLMAAPLMANPRHIVVVRPAFGWGWYEPYWGPYGYGYPYGYYPAPATGEVKFDTKEKETQVFIDGAYAGTTGKLKKIDLAPGSYNIELRVPNEPSHAEKVYVIAGKTVHIKPNM